MRILLTNDDGITACGLTALHRRLTELGDVFVVAPSACRSGTSHSITYIEPLTYEEINVAQQFNGISVHGSPADCVKLACHVLLDNPVDLVVSGINNGANVGINMYYSGTVAAAIEAAFLKIPAVAFSVTSGPKVNFDSAAGHAMEVLASLLPMEPQDIININIPALNGKTPKGMRVVPQATDGFEEYYLQQDGGAGLPAYQLNAGPFRPDSRPTDAGLLEDGYITVTPIQVDMTHHRELNALKKRLVTKSE